MSKLPEIVDVTLHTQKIVL